MGTWYELGTLQPNTNGWQLWPISTQGEVFLARHTWTQQDWYRPVALIAQFFDGWVHAPRRLYARDGLNELLEFKIPDQFRQSGAVRQIGILLKTPYIAIPASFYWQVALDVYEVDFNAPGSPDAYQDDFAVTDLDLDGDLIVTHGLGATPTSVTVYNENREIVVPNSVRVIDENNIEVDLDGFNVTDTWEISIEV
jgi:hypothetical protein